VQGSTFERGEMAMVSERMVDSWNPRMWRRAIVFGMGLAVVVASLAATPVGASTIGDPNERTPANPVYTVDLTSDANGFAWTGTESVTFTNVAALPLDEVWFRLWDNYASCGGSLAIDVTNVQGGTPGPLAVGCTALPVTLPAPLGQGEQATLSFDLSITVPNTNWRFGRIGKMALLGNALPVLAIHDGEGWHLPPYTSNGESFYSQVGDFSVTLTTPIGLSVAATGVASSARQSSSPSHKARGQVTTTFDAPQVRDFAWASGPLREKEQATSTGVLVKVWWPSDITNEEAHDMLVSSVRALEGHTSAYGPYLYQEVDVVLGNFSGFGGMEYPQLVMEVPSDFVTIHELAHQWWFGMVGDDEYQDPWLDESFASYATDIYLGDYGSYCPGLRFPSRESRITNSMAYWDRHTSEYGLVVYTLGPCALHAMARLFGQDVMATFLHDYAVEHSLGWSTTAGFKEEAQAVANSLPEPIDLTSFWKRWRIVG
jgi:peptidase M1-like protein